jgi:hypothetical protein
MEELSNLVRYCNNLQKSRVDIISELVGAIERGVSIKDIKQYLIPNVRTNREKQPKQLILDMEDISNRLFEYDERILIDIEFWKINLEDEESFNVDDFLTKRNNKQI